MCIHAGIVKNFYFIKEKDKILYKRKKIFKNIFYIYIDFFFQFNQHLYLLLIYNFIVFFTKKCS